MDEILMWAKNLCIAAIGSALLGFLLPKGNVQKTGRAVLGFFMIWMVFLPFASFLTDEPSVAASFSLPEEEVFALSEDALSVYESQMEEVIASLLQKEGYAYSAIRAVCHTSEDGVIDISRVEITCESGGEAIRTYLQEQTGLVVEIISE